MWMVTAVAAMVKDEAFPTTTEVSPTQTLPKVGDVTLCSRNDVAAVTSTVVTVTLGGDTWLFVAVSVNEPSAPAVPQVPGALLPLTAVTVPCAAGAFPFDAAPATPPVAASAAMVSAITRAALLRFFMWLPFSFVMLRPRRFRVRPQWLDPRPARQRQPHLLQRG